MPQARPSLLGPRSTRKVQPVQSSRASFLWLFSSVAMVLCAAKYAAKNLLCIDRPRRNSTRFRTASSLRPRGRTTNKTRKSYRRRSRGLEMLQAWAALQAGGESIIWYATVFATPVVVTKR